MKHCCSWSHSFTTLSNLCCVGSLTDNALVSIVDMVVSFTQLLQFGPFKSSVSLAVHLGNLYHTSVGVAGFTSISQPKKLFGSFWRLI